MNERLVIGQELRVTLSFRGTGMSDVRQPLDSPVLVVAIVMRAVERSMYNFWNSEKLQGVGA
jgi:hypothetical protein